MALADWNNSKTLRACPHYSLPDLFFCVLQINPLAFSKINKKINLSG